MTRLFPIVTVDISSTAGASDWRRTYKYSDVSSVFYSPFAQVLNTNSVEHQQDLLNFVFVVGPETIEQKVFSIIPELNHQSQWFWGICIHYKIILN